MKDVTKIIPAPGYCLIEPRERETKTESGLYLPESINADAPQSGTVVAVGGDELTDSGHIRSCWVRDGDNVLFKKWGGNEVKVGKKNYLFVKFDDILGKSDEEVS